MEVHHQRPQPTDAETDSYKQEKGHSTRAQLPKSCLFFGMQVLEWSYTTCTPATQGMAVETSMPLDLPQLQCPEKSLQT